MFLLLVVQNVQEDDDPAVMGIALILYINHVILCLVDILVLQLKVSFVRLFQRTVIWSSVTEGLW